jgi:hypothetical protein
VAIRGIEKMSLAQVEAQLRQGACFVFYEYCISLVVITLRRPSDIYFLPPPSDRLTRDFLAKLLLLTMALIAAVACWVLYAHFRTEEAFGTALALTLGLVAVPLRWIYKTCNDSRWRDETGLKRGFVYSLVSLFLGWWGVPWGLIYTPMTVFTNLCGGQDVTDEVWALLESAEQ